MSWFKDRLTVKRADTHSFTLNFEPKDRLFKQGTKLACLLEIDPGKTLGLESVRIGEYHLEFRLEQNTDKTYFLDLMETASDNGTLRHCVRFLLKLLEDEDYVEINEQGLLPWFKPEDYTDQ